MVSSTARHDLTAQGGAAGRLGQYAREQDTAAGAAGDVLEGAAGFREVGTRRRGDAVVDVALRQRSRG